MGILHPEKLKRIRIWLLDRAYFDSLVKTLSDHGPFHLKAIMKMPPDSKYGSSYIVGWIPADIETTLTKQIQQATDGQCIIKLEEPGKGEEIPVLLRHGRFIKPFEKLVLAFGTPSINELDPTLLVAAFFLLVFGLMFADIGHGLLLIILGLVVLTFEGKVKISGILSYVLDNGSLFLFCGVSGVLGGVLFGDIFGYHIKLLPFTFTIPKPINVTFPFSPIENPITMFKLSILVGAVHIASGLILNVINKLSDKKYREAFFEPICWLWFYIALIYAVFLYTLDLAKWLGSPVMLWGIMLPVLLMFVGKAMLHGFEGFISTIETLISSLSNTVSYLRIAALSLVHSALSVMIINMGGGNNPLIIIIGSFFVMVLEGLIIFLHTTRLVWVEWFSKFYKDEGRPFKSLELEALPKEGVVPSVTM